jgi:chlorobactene lauroyltransferase
MLEANKANWFEWLFTVYNGNLIRRRFNSFQVLGLTNLENRNPELPTLIYCNHSTWWDGLIAYQLCRKVKLDNFIMMEEKQLKNLQLFRKLGAFSVVRESPREALKSINYAVKLLREENNRSVWIFPQGEIQPSNIKPLVFYNGLSGIIKKLKTCQVICVVMRFEFLGKYKPDIFLKIDEPILFSEKNVINTKETTRELALIARENLDLLNEKLNTANFKGFNNLI